MNKSYKENSVHIRIVLESKNVKLMSFREILSSAVKIHVYQFCAFTFHSLHTCPPFEYTFSNVL